MSVVDQWLDRSIVFSFDRTGYRRHAKGFEPLTPRALDGTTLITGGTAGIGLAAAAQLDALGVRTLLWGRNPERGAEAAATLANGTFTSVDLADLGAVAGHARQLEGPIDNLVLNAGAMPLERTLTPAGHELMWASQVLGHLLLVRILRDSGHLSGDARVVWVSSGGMYAQRLDLRDLTWDGRYQRHTVYANAKRAQVMLNRHLAERWPDLWTAAMHPGWVDTAAVQHSMPVFRALTRPILRSPDEGADTISWLCAAESPGASGQFWFDREVQPEHLQARTRASENDAEPLLTAVFEATEPHLNGADAT